jgi:predicted nucleic acid-binding protein
MKRALSLCDWLEVTLLDPPISISASKRLGAGEGEAIELARRHGLSLVLDDRAGRHAAEELGIQTLGTLSVVALAKQHGYIESFDDRL